MSVTRKQAIAEAGLLKDLKPKVRQYSGFDDNHWEAIEAQIEVLEGDLDDDAIYDAYGDDTAEEFSQNLLDAALDARRWMDGDSKESPSDSWAPLAK